jgi:hypothetical protein
MATQDPPNGGQTRLDSEDDLVIRVPNLRRIVRQWLPAEAVTHMRAARREQLLAARALLDAALQRVERDEERERRRSARVDIPID